MDYKAFTPKQASDYAMKSSMFPQDLYDRFELGSKAITNRAQAVEFIKAKKKDGFTITSKLYGGFTSIGWAKMKPAQEGKIQWTPYLASAYAEGFCEGEGATEEERLEAWAYLIKTGLCWSLQGWYGRNADNLIQSGIISKEGVIL